MSSIASIPFVALQLRMCLSVGPAVLGREVRPLARGDPEIFVEAARESEAEVMGDFIARLARQLVLGSCSQAGRTCALIRPIAS